MSPHPTATPLPTIDSRLPDAEPYEGDDWAQSMARWMATPLLVMGVMAVFVSLALGIAGGVTIGGFFGDLASPDLADLGRTETLAHWSGALAFLGMGLLLGGIVMHLVNIVCTLRDSGRDVQRSLGAGLLKLRKPWTGKATPHVMLMGVMVEVAAFVAGVAAALSIGGVRPGALADPATATSAELADIGVAQAAAAWLPGLRFVGLAILLTSVVLVLLTIQKTLRFQSDRITEIAARPPKAKGVAPSVATNGGERQIPAAIPGATSYPGAAWGT